MSHYWALCSRITSLILTLVHTRNQPSNPPLHRITAITHRYTLAKEWTHPSGPVSFNHSAGGTRVTLARMPALKGAPPATAVIFNVGDTLVIHNYYAGAAGGKKGVEPVKVLTFPGTFITCHAHSSARSSTSAADAHDLLLGLSNGEVISTSLRACIADGGNTGRAVQVDPGFLQLTPRLLFGTFSS